MGIYLSGTLTYNDFNFVKSDIDLFIFLDDQITTQELAFAKKLHRKIEKDYPIWTTRLECSYILVDMLKSMSIPKTQTL